MGDEALFADLALPVVVSPILEKVTSYYCNVSEMIEIERFTDISIKVII